MLSKLQVSISLSRMTDVNSDVTFIGDVVSRQHMTVHVEMDNTSQWTLSQPVLSHCNSVQFSPRCLILLVMWREGHQPVKHELRQSPTIYLWGPNLILSDPLKKIGWLNKKGILILILTAFLVRPLQEGHGCITSKMIKYSYWTAAAAALVVEVHPVWQFQTVLLVRTEADLILHAVTVYRYYSQRVDSLLCAVDDMYVVRRRVLEQSVPVGELSDRTRSDGKGAARPDD